MLRSLVFPVVGVIALSFSTVVAEESPTPKSGEKTKTVQVEKKKQPPADPNDSAPKSTKVKNEKAKPEEAKPTEKKVVKGEGATKVRPEKAPVAAIGSETEYYTTSPAQGRPADGQFPAGTKVRIVEKAGSYVRVVAEIEAYVPADSFAKPAARKKQPPVDKTALKQKSAGEPKAAAPQKKILKQKEEPK